MDTGTTQRTAATTEVLEGLNDLLQLDHDAIGAYEIAMEKLSDRDHAAMIAGFRRDHERHVRDLNEMITSLGGTPKNEPHMTGPLKEALQSIGAVGGDKGLLIAWRTNELQVRTKYDAYASKANQWPAEAKRLIDVNALDEERHYQWVVGVLGGSGDASGAIDTVKDKASAIAGAVSNRISGAFDPDGDGALSSVGSAAVSARDGIAGAGDRAVEYRDSFETRVRQKPLQTLAIAAVAGFVVGRILR